VSLHVYTERDIRNSKFSLSKNRVAQINRRLLHYLQLQRYPEVATSQYFGSLYYRMPVWYQPFHVKNKKKLEVLYYKLLQVVVKNWHRIYPKFM